MEFKETKNYYVDYTEDQHGQAMYGIVNRETGIVEFKHPAYPVVHSQMEMIQEMMDAIEAGEEPESEELPNNVKPLNFGKDD